MKKVKILAIICIILLILFSSVVIAKFSDVDWAQKGAEVGAGVANFISAVVVGSARIVTDVPTLIIKSNPALEDKVLEIKAKIKEADKLSDFTVNAVKKRADYFVEEAKCRKGNPDWYKTPPCKKRVTKIKITPGKAGKPSISSEEAELLKIFKDL